MQGVGTGQVNIDRRQCGRHLNYGISNKISYSVLDKSSLKVIYLSNIILT